MKLDIMRFLGLLTSVGVAQTYFSVQNNYSLTHCQRAVYMECTMPLHLGDYGSQGLNRRGMRGVPYSQKFGLLANLQQIFSLSANLLYTTNARRCWNARKAFFIDKFGF